MGVSAVLLGGGGGGGERGDIDVGCTINGKLVRLGIFLLPTRDVSRSLHGYVAERTVAVQEEIASSSRRELGVWGGVLLSARY